MKKYIAIYFLAKGGVNPTFFIIFLKKRLYLVLMFCRDYIIEFS
jgi:hypothetical protein